MNYVQEVFNVENKIVIITGGSGVLGSAMAKGLLQAGAKVILLGTSEEKLTRKVDYLYKPGSEIIGLKCNVLDEENIVSVNNKIIQKYGNIDVLINAAGGNVPSAVIPTDKNVFDMKFDEFKKVTDLNLNGTVLPTLVFGKSMAQNKKGSIINISSMAVQRAITRVVGYSAAKAAVENFTRWMAVELAQKFGDALRVNAIAPGFFITEQNKKVLLNEDGSLSERAQAIMEITPFKRFGNPDELIGTIIWLASDASKFVTGTVIPIDGGFSAFSGV